MGKSMNSFEIQLPDGWEDQTVYFFRGPKIDDRDHQIIMTIDRNPRQDNIAEFASLRTRPVVEAMQGVEILKDEETTLSGCYPSYEFVYKWIPAEGIKVLKKNIFVLHGRYGFSFEIEFSKKSYKMLGGAVRKLIEKILPGTYEPTDE